MGRIFYDIILATKGQDFLTEEEIEFGRTNLTDKPKAFIEFLQNKLKVLENVSNKKDIKQETKEQLILETERLSKYVKN